jgi:hypothetical protein
MKLHKVHTDENFSKDISKLIMCADVFDFYLPSLHSLPDEVKLDINVFSAIMVN